MMTESNANAVPHLVLDTMEKKNSIYQKRGTISNIRDFLNC